MREPRPMLKFLDAYFEEILGGLLLALMALIAFANVIVRYCTNLSFSASEELTVNLFVWIVLLGTSRAFREGSNFSMNVIYNAASRRVQTALTVFGAVCTTLFFLMLIWQGTVEVMDEIELEVVSESLAIPVWIYTVAVPLFSVLILVRLAQHTVRRLRDRQYGLDREGA
jgi:TRAP-type C4-dicarboxylate transport system permease small subunit